jgi:hypothetical protein
MRKDSSSFIAAILVSARILALSEAVQVVSTNVDIRHPTRPFVPTTGSLEYVNSPLMATPCQPAKNGYFGGTSGIPALFEYAFEMESTATGNIQEALLVIEERVIFEVIADTFPQLCGRERFLQEVQEEEIPNQSRVTGFKFGSTPQIDLDGKCRNKPFQVENQVADSTSHSLIQYTFLKVSCVPLLNDVNYCGLYKTKITVFGHNLRSDEALTHIMEKALESVGRTHIEVASLGIIRLVPSEKHTRIVGDDFDYNAGVTRSGNSLAPGFKAGMIVSALTLIGGILFLVFHLHMDLRSQGESKAGKRGTGRKREFLSLLRYFSGNSTHVDDGSADYTDSAFENSIYMEEFADDRRTVLVKMEKDFNILDDRSVAEYSAATAYVLD